VIRVLLVDDHPAMLDALARALESDPEMEVVGQARDGREADRLILATGPDVVVCDVQMGGDAGGLRVLERHGSGGDRGGPTFLMLSAYDYPSLFRTAFERGAAGYLLKTSELRDVLAAVRTVAGGGTAFTAASMRVIRRALRRPSAREIEVLEMVAAGASNDEIAAQLSLSLKTVESHLRRMFDRYGVMNRTELAVLALKEGWVSPG
jgi:DNA-binding NarL/FixJ family response regulator